MAKRVFIAFAAEDIRYRDFLVAQAKNENSPFDFTDMSVKEPWDTEWRIHCRQRIQGCDGIIALVSKHTKNASGEIFEIKCAIEEGIPLMAMYINDDRPSLPDVLQGKKINVWSWPNLKNFVSNL